MTEIERITKNLREGFYNSNPVQASEDHAVLAGEFSWMMGQLEQILQSKPSIWNAIRSDSSIKSDTAAERKWEATEMGINEQGLRLRAKGVEKMMSALKSLIRIAEGEAKSQW